MTQDIVELTSELEVYEEAVWKACPIYPRKLDMVTECQHLQHMPRVQEEEETPSLHTTPKLQIESSSRHLPLSGSGRFFLKVYWNRSSNQQA